MTEDKLSIAIQEAERFIKRAKDLRKKRQADKVRVQQAEAAGNKYVYSDQLPKESGSVRRASMDLTRALADLRRYSA